MSMDLLDYRLQVFSHYAQIRSSSKTPEKQAAIFRGQRDLLFANHPQSALSEKQKHSFIKLDYFEYDPLWKKKAILDFNLEPKEFEVALKDDGSFRMRRLAYAHFAHNSEQVKLSLFWLSGYAGGIFLPFRDASRKTGDTYPGTRYLFDTIKGADLGSSRESINLDFNFAYNPSCAYNPAWDCPLAPEENWLAIPVFAGEKAFRLNNT